MTTDHVAKGSPAVFVMRKKMLERISGRMKESIGSSEEKDYNKGILKYLQRRETRWNIAESVW